MVTFRWRQTVHTGEQTDVFLQVARNKIQDQKQLRGARLERIKK